MPDSSTSPAARLPQRPSRALRRPARAPRRLSLPAAAALALQIATLLSLQARPCCAGDPVRRQAADLGARAAVVRLEAAIDPASCGPQLSAELAARHSWTPYEAEIARRLHIGSTGTGFFVNSRGDLVTNAHVLLSGVRYRGLHFTHAEWDSLTRLLNAIRDIWVTVGEGGDERSYLAVPVAIAEDLDLAVLRVCRPAGDDTEFRVLRIADSDALRVGDPISALGFPENGFQDSPGLIVSLISGRHVHEEMQVARRVDPETGLESVTVSGSTSGPVLRLQHSAPTGHGSSGGPLVDRRGEVVGVAYALLARRGPSPDEGTDSPPLNLAIASNVLKRFLRENAIPFAETAR